MLSAIIILLFITETSQMDVVPDAEVAKSIADWFQVTCTVFFRLEMTTLGENQKILQEMKIMFEGMKSVTIRKLLPEKTRYRYNSQRCSQMLHVIDGRRDDAKHRLEQMSYSAHFSGQIWLVFLPVNDTAEAYFQMAYIPFDSNFIAVETRDSIILRQVYRVSMKHDIRTVPFGNWSDGLIVHKGYYPYWRRNNLEGKSFKVSAIENWPLTTLEPDNTIGGYFGRVWKELQERLNFSTVYVKPKDFATGFWNNGTWNGLIGMISRGEIDAAVSEVTMTPERLPAVDFLKPLYTTRYQLFFRSPGMMIQWNLILLPFQTEVWLTLLLWLGFLTFLLHIGYQIGVRYGLEDSTYKTEYQCYHCLFFVASAFSQQANSVLPKSGFCRLILATAYMLSTVVVIIYSCTLMSLLAVEKPSRPFDSLETFLRDGTYSLHQIPGTDAYAYFSNSTDPVLREIYETKFPNLSEEDLPKTHKSALERVCENEKIAHLGEYGLVVVSADELQVKKGCRFIFLERPLKLLYLTMAVTKDSPYRDAFDYHLGQMAVTGGLSRFRQMKFPLGEKMIDVTFHPVTIEQTAQMNLLLMAGFLAAIFALFGELLVKGNSSICWGV